MLGARLGAGVTLPVLVEDADDVLVLEAEMVGDGEQLATLAVAPAPHAPGQPQGVHEVAPDALEKVPAAQMAQEDAPLPLK